MEAENGQPNFKDLPYFSIWNILSVLGANEYLERLEGNIRKRLFFHVKTL